VTTTVAEAPVIDERVTTPAVMEATGATYRQLIWWVRSGYCRPDNADRGTGYPMLWPPTEVRVARLMVRLLSLGFHLEQAAVMARDDDERRRVTDRLADIEDGL